MHTLHFPASRLLVRLNGYYGTRAVLTDLQDLRSVTRGKNDHLLDQADIQASLALPPDQSFTLPESRMVHTLPDCSDHVLSASGKHFCMIVATYPAGTTTPRIGITRDGLVYELFFTNLNQL